MPTYTFDARNVRDGSTDVKAGQALTMEWECVTDDHLLDAGDVIAALDSILGIGKGSPHPTYGYALCTNVAAAVDPKDPFRWTVRATFLEPRPQPGDPPNPPGGQPSPPDRQGYIRGNFRREDVFRGVDNTPVIVGPPAYLPLTFANSAGDLFDNPPPVPTGLGQFIITRYFDVISYTALRAYQNCCNHATWQGFPRHSLCILGIEWAPHSERGWFGSKVDVTVEHRPGPTPEQEKIHPTWRAKLRDLPGGVITGGFHPLPVLDVGWYYKTPDGEKVIYDEPAGSQAPKTVPGLLDGVSGLRADGVHYLGFDIHPRIDFTGLLGPA